MIPDTQLIGHISTLRCYRQALMEIVIEIFIEVLTEVNIEVFII